jgi:hypothetical protein
LSRGTFTGHWENHGLSNGEAVKLSAATDARKKSVDRFSMRSAFTQVYPRKLYETEVQKLPHQPFEVRLVRKG